MILGGILLGDLSVLAFLARPSKMACAASLYGFLLAVAIMYAPLLVKANRIYRIFNSGSRGQKTKYTGTRSVVILTSLLILGEVGKHSHKFTRDCNPDLSDL